MTKQEYVIIADYSEDDALTLAELCDICGLSAQDVQVFIEYDIIHPKGSVPTEWVFDIVQLQRIKTALRLQRDLEVNLAGAVMVLDLLDEMAQLRERAALLERHLLK